MTKTNYSPDTIDALVKDAVFGDENSKAQAQQKVREIAAESGVVPASMQGFYEAMGKGLCGNVTVPAMNIRGITYHVVRAAFRAALKLNVGALVFELSPTEMGYTQQKPSEYATCVLAAAVREGFQGPVFILGDHYQLKRDQYEKDPEQELNRIKELIRESIAAGFLNIDIDASTLVDLSKESLLDQQHANSEATAALTAFIRSIEPKGVAISVGGEIGEIGKQNSTVEDLKAFMKGYRELLGPDSKGISKISVQTGATHGGVVLPNGSLADVALDFNTLKDISDVAREEYGMGGAVQHGASTLPDDFFELFPKARTAEVHLATGFQNIIYDSPDFPKELLEKVNSHLVIKYAAEKKQGDTDAQLIYRTRKKAFGDFKKELWALPDDVINRIGASLEERFLLLFKSLNAAETKPLIDKYTEV